MADAVKKYVKEKRLPAGYRFSTWDDTSIEVRERMDLLLRNGMQGLILVFVILSLFLDLKLAFWIAMGIPISLLGACAVLWQFDQTLNMLSLFLFLIALGIVVDDAIVIGENVYAHRNMGKSPMQAAIDGTIEVVPSVFRSVATTVFAFIPMFFVTGGIRYHRCERRTENRSHTTRNSPGERSGVSPPVRRFRTGKLTHAARRVGYASAVRSRNGPTIFASGSRSIRNES